MCDHHNNNNLNDKKRFGSAIEHGEAHEKDHGKWSRRDFLTSIGLAGAGSMVLGGLPLSTLGATPLAAALNNSETDRVLVLIRLAGGNDGLNTIIPLNQYDYYANVRPSIRIPENQITALGNGDFGIPEAMDPLLPMWNEGLMKVLHTVGYPDQNLSHFRSSDIWTSGSDADVIDETGWLGRYLTDTYPNFLVEPPAAPPAIQIGKMGTFNGMLNNGIVDLGFSVNNPTELYEIAQTGQLYDPLNIPDCTYGEQIGYLRAVSNSTITFAESINTAYEAGANAVDYTFGNLGNQLALIARLIKGGLGSKIYMVEIGGFDTHSEQAFNHFFLMNSIANSVQQFYDDLNDGGWGDKVLSVTLSEFGRRIEENASFGTDHGAAAPMMFFGGEMEGEQSLGTIPDLLNPDMTGNLQYHTDFRQVYATLLEDWLCVEPDVVNGVLGNNFERLSDLVVSCNADNPSTAYGNPNVNSLLSHFVSMEKGQSQLHINLSKAGTLSIDAYNTAGQKVKNIFNGYRVAGNHNFDFNPHALMLPLGAYIYSIQFEGQTYSGKLMNFGFR